MDMKKLRTAGTIILAFIGLYFIPSCLSNKTRPFITPPLKNLNIPFNSKKINPKINNTLSFPGGSSIDIPANAFVNEKNEPVTKKVEISFREMKNAIDVMMSGIPMTYDSAGVENSFTTAGMFEVYGYSEGKPVFIANDKKVTVNMVGNVQGNYNFYQLDTINKKWVYISAGTAQNTYKIDKSVQISDSELISKIEIPQPIAPRKQSKKMTIFDFDVDYSAFPELAGFKYLVWEFLPEMNDKKDKSGLDWVYNTKWTDMKVIPYDVSKGYYQLKLSANKTSFEAIVAPVLSGKEYKKAMNDFKDKLKDYNVLLEEKKLDLQRVQNVNSFLRKYDIINFGIFNCDKIYSRPDFVKLDVKFIIKNHPEINTSELIIFHITDGNQAVLRYYPTDKNAFFYCSSDNNKLVTFLKGNKMAVFKNQGFQSLQRELDASGRSLPCIINMDVVEKTVNSLDDIMVNL
jgi:hypothetical protein